LQSVLRLFFYALIMPIKLYHLVPKNLQGKTLYPLNQLKSTHPERYAEHIKKYNWRKETLQGIIPILNCLWNDVLHFSPVHPQQVKNNYQNAGFTVNTLRAFEINAKTLEPSRTVIYQYLHKPSKDRSVKYSFPNNFVPYDLTKLNAMTELPESTKTYYAEMFAKGKRPLAFVGVPHVLYKGSLDISDVPIIEV